MGAGLKLRVKEQVAASMFLNISYAITSKMCLPEFEMVQEAAKEIQEGLQNDGHTAPGSFGKARIF